MTLYKWSRTAAADATADASINWQEGQAPSSVNDSARAMMAATAKYRDDVAGAIVTSGTSTAYTVSSYQVFETLSLLNGQVIAFVPHATNGAAVTFNVDGLGAKPLRSAPNAELAVGVLVQGTPYACTYNHADGAFYLHGLFGNPYNVPIGSCIDFFGTTAPNSAFVLAYGQAISRATYSTLFALFGTTYGAGDGSATFNIPDLRGRVVAGKDDMGGSAASRLTSSYFGSSAASLGAVGGAESLALTLAQIPTGITAATTASIPLSVTSSSSNIVTASSTISAQSGGGAAGLGGAAVGSQMSTGIIASGVQVTSNNTSGNAHRTVQPTIIANKLIRIL
jgi:microcystin-dependent protein